MPRRTLLVRSRVRRRRNGSSGGSGSARCTGRALRRQSGSGHDARVRQARRGPLAAMPEQGDPARHEPIQSDLSSGPGLVRPTQGGGRARRIVNADDPSRPRLLALAGLKSLRSAIAPPARGNRDQPPGFAPFRLAAVRTRSGTMIGGGPPGRSVGDPTVSAVGPPVPPTPDGRGSGRGRRGRRPGRTTPGGHRSCGRPSRSRCSPETS